METRALLDEATEAHGLKKGFVIEEALLHHLLALRELPSDVVIPGRITLTEASAKRVAQALAKPQRPTAALRALRAGEDGDDLPS